MTQDKWQAWWEIVWLNLLHVFGIIAAVGVFLWLVWTFVGPIVLPPKEVRDQTTNERKATQAVFQRALMNVPKPCAVKGKPYSDVRGCSVFGLRLGMSLEDVKETLDGSGYFSDRTSLIKGCIERVPRCVGFVRQSNGDFSLTVYLMPAWEGDTTQLAIFDITLQIGPRTLPYFTPEHIRTTLRACSAHRINRSASVTYGAATSMTAGRILAPIGTKASLSLSLPINLARKKNSSRAGIRPKDHLSKTVTIPSIGRMLRLTSRLRFGGSD